MKDDSIHPSPDDIACVLRGVRFALVSIILGFCYVGLRASLAIPDFRRVFADMLEGATLPTLTSFVIGWRFIILAFNCLIPVAAISTVFMRPNSRCFYILGALALLALFSGAIVCTALSRPLFQLVDQLPGIKP
jgi:hypothetical protein